MNIPTKDQCIELLKGNKTPHNIIEHCEAVSKFAVAIARKIEAKKIPVNKDLVQASALLHDIEKLKKNHVKAGHDLLVQKGFPDVARVVKKHGLENFDDASFHPKAIEEKIVFYADKRVKDTSIVSLEQRFSYIREKYSVPHIEQEFEYAVHIEQELQEMAGERL